MRTCATKKRDAARLILLLFCSCSTAAAVVLIAGCGSSAQQERVPPPASVTVVLSRKMTLPLVVKPIGTTRALNEVTIRARVKGFLQEKHFEDGKNVKKGQLLLVIEKRPYEVQVEAAKAQLAAAKASLEKATASKIVPVSRAKLSLDAAQLTLDQIEERRERSLLRAMPRRAMISIRPKPSARKAPPRSNPMRPAWPRQRPTTGSILKTPRPKSPGRRPPLKTRKSIWATVRCSLQSMGGSAS